METAQRVGILLVRAFPVLAIWLWGAASHCSAAPDDWPAEATAVLQRFVGQWRTSTQIRRVLPHAREIDTRGKATCETMLQGRYYSFRSETVPPGDSELQIMTYDAPAAVYRQWVFTSDGYRHEAEGRWDAATSTLRWSGKTDNASFSIDDHWATPDRLEWTLRRTDRQGRLTQTISGTVERDAAR
ncbi:MAG: DUF1579 family protein [Pirellulales bacterium]